MKLLYINHYAGSVYHGMEFRPYYLSCEWIKSGHEVVIVGASFSHLRQKNIEMTQDILEENIDGIRYVWLKTPEYKGNGIGRIKNMLTFLYKLYKYLPKITKNFVPDAVIASSTYPLDSYPANRIAKKHKAKFVFELHDLWPMSPMVYGNMSKWHPFIMIMQKAEDYWCKNADVVVSLLSHAYKHLTERGMSMDKYHVVPNGVALEDWKETEAELPEEHQKLFAKLTGEGKFVVGYLGGHGLSNHLESIIYTAEKLKNDTETVFVLVGKGPEKEKLIKLAEELKLNNVYFLPPVSNVCVPQVTALFDICSCFVEHTALNEFGMSLNKIYDYMMSAKPIVWGAKVPNDIVAESGCGYTVSPEDTDAFAEKILALKAMSKEERMKMGEKGGKYILENNTYSVLAEKFIDAIKS